MVWRRSISVKVSEDVWREFKMKASKLNMTMADILKLLIMAFLKGKISINNGEVRVNSSIKIDEDEDMKPVSVSMIAEYMIMEMIRDGYSVMFNVKIDKKNGRIIVTKPNALINVQID